MAQHDVLAIQELGVECHLAASIAQLWREWRIIMGYRDVDGTGHISRQTDGDFYVNILLNGFYVNALPIDHKPIALSNELASSMVVQCGLDGLDTLFAVETQVTDTVIEQGGGLGMACQPFDVDMALVGQGVMDQ